MQFVDLKSLSEQTSLSVFSFGKYTKMGMYHYRVGRKILVDPNEFETAAPWSYKFGLNY